MMCVGTEPLPLCLMLSFGKQMPFEISGNASSVMVSFSFLFNLLYIKSASE